MKIKTIIDINEEERFILYSKKRSALVDATERLFSLPEDKICNGIEQILSASEASELIGFNGREGIRVITRDVVCFTVEDRRVYALTQNEKLLLKLRLYQLEEMLGNKFVKINQSSIANIEKIERFDTSISGTLLVKFKNGHRDYVSRRCLKNVKERLGL